MALQELIYVVYINIGNTHDDKIDEFMNKYIDGLKAAGNNIKSANIQWIGIPIRVGTTRIEQLYYNYSE